MIPFSYVLRRRMMRVIETARLPKEYQEVEYIQSSGTQYINTGVAYSPNNYNKIKVQFDAKFANKSGAYEVNGTGSSSQNNFYVGNYNGKLVYGNGRGDVTTTYSATARAVFAIDTLNKVVTQDGSTRATFTPNSPTSALNLFLFGYNKFNSAATCHGETLYSCQIYESNVLIRDLVPCYRKADGAVGLYDLVNGAFYTNAGSGTFAKGADVGGTVAPPVTPPSGDVSFTYTGTFTDNRVDGKGKVRLTTSGVLNVTGGSITISVTVVGAGGGAAQYGTSGIRGMSGGGGGGNQTITVTLNSGTYEIIIGVGGTPFTGQDYAGGNKGGDTTAFGTTSTGGEGGHVGAMSSANYGGTGGTPSGGNGNTAVSSSGNASGGSPNGGSVVNGVAQPGGDGYVELTFP